MPGLLGARQSETTAVPRFQRKTAFKVFSTVNLTPQVGGTTVDFTAATYDLGDNFNLTTNQYVIPYQGLYNYNCYFVGRFTGAGASSTPSLEMQSQFGTAFILYAETFNSHANLDVFSVSAAGSHIFQQGDQLRLVAFGANNHIYVGAEVSYYWSMYRVETESRTVLGG